MRYIVTLEVESQTHPDNWFWTDACPDPSDEIHVTSVEEIGEEDG